MVGAARLLERPHEVRGMAGDTPAGGGITIRVPNEILLPPDGCYAGHLTALEYPGEWRHCEVRIENPEGSGTVVVVSGEDLAHHAGDAVRLSFDRPV
jgi:hypothetical protein